MEYKSKSNDLKKKSVKDLQQLMDKYDIVGILNVENLPAKQLQNMRETLRADVVILGSKKRLIRLALKASKKTGIEKLGEQMVGMPAMLFTNENPFKLSKTLKKNKSKAPIKAGQIAPNDIIVKAGPTPFAPGPIIGELGMFKIKTGVENGKVAIKEDAVVAKTGEEVSQALAGLLTRFGIEPMDVGLDLVAVFENGEILTKDVLNIDEDQFMNSLRAAGAQAFNLSMNSGYPTKDTIAHMLAKGYSEGRNLALSQDIVTEDTIKDLIAKAQNQAVSLQKDNKPVQTPQEDAKQEPKDDKKSDEGKKEAPAATGLGALFG